MRRCLVVVAKQPIAGEVKTRLAASIGTEQALGLYLCALKDTLELVSGYNVAVKAVLSYAPATLEARSFFQELAVGFLLLSQSVGDFGERLLDTFRQLAQRGMETIVMIGTDSPNLPRAYLDLAFAALDDPAVDAVLGPATDGGYYLIGMRRPHPLLFERIHWSTGVVAAETSARAVEAGLRLVTIPGWYDLDTVDDLHLLLNDVTNPAPRTRAYLQDLDLTTAKRA